MKKGEMKVTRRGFLRKAGAIAVSAALALTAFGCSAPATSSSSSSASSAATDTVDYSDWDAVLEAAKGQTVTWYGWGGSEPRNNWIDNVVAPKLKAEYDITLDRVGMNINDVLTQLSGEMQAGGDGTIDFIWINGENFYSAKENGYLWGPFCDYLPNFNDYVDATSTEIAYDFGSKVDGYEAPYGKAQMQMWVNSAEVPNPPTTVDAFMDFCKANQGKVTYAEPGDFAGTAFISCLIAGVIGQDEFEKLSQMTDPTEDEVKAIVQPGLDYLKELAPYLWNNGTTYPAEQTTVDAMYADGELIMDYGYGDPQVDVDNGTLPATTKSFLFDSGTVGNTNFMAIAANAPHKAAAMVAINEVLSPAIQLSQYEDLGTISVLDLSKLSSSEQAAFDAVELGSAQLPLSDLLDHRVSEASGPVIPILEKLWHSEVLGA